MDISSIPFMPLGQKHTTGILRELTLPPSGTLCVKDIPKLICVLQRATQFLYIYSSIVSLHNNFLLKLIFHIHIIQSCMIDLSWIVQSVGSFCKRNPFRFVQYLVSVSDISDNPLVVYFVITAC